MVWRNACHAGRVSVIRVIGVIPEGAILRTPFASEISKWRLLADQVAMGLDRKVEDHGNER